ncbi:hypothetical protein [Maribacter sp. ACAM166]|nr:hypothetical protein [Maribacter sp. ACAM166]
MSWKVTTTMEQKIDGYIGVMVLPISVEWCHFEILQLYSDPKKL